MAIPPSPTLSKPLPALPSAEAGPSKRVVSPSNKRAASTSLSDSETLVTKAIKTPQPMVRSLKVGSAKLDAHRRKRRKKRFSVTRKVLNASRSSLATSSTMSLKGKEQEVNGTTNNERPRDDVVDENASDELVSLRTKFDQQKILLDAHKEFLELLAPSLTCQICLDPMYRPYTLAPCGHTACYDCLLAWFRAPPAHIAQPPPDHLLHNFDVDDPTLLARDTPMLLRKEKTCPHCRAVVQEAPVEAWGIKDIVHHLFDHKGDVAKELYPSHTRQREGDTVPSGAEAWNGVFRRAHIPGLLAVPNRNRRNRDDAANGEEDQGDRGFYDEEDAVYRCTQCYHEIWDGLCTSCGRLYPGLHRDFEDEDDDADPAHWMDADEFDGLADQELAAMDAEDVNGELNAHFRGIVGALGFYRTMNARHDHDEEGADDDGYESSFIDDGEEQPRIDEFHSAEEDGNFETEDEVMSDIVEDHRPRRIVPPPIARADDDSAEEARGRRRLSTINLTDSDSDAYRRPTSSLRRGTRALRTRIESDDDADSDVQQVRRIRVPGGSRGRHVVIDSDSEHEDQHSDEDAHAHRRGGLYRRSLSDEESLQGSFSENGSENGSDHSSQHDLRGSISGLSHENYENYVFSDEEDISWWS
ncbi:uncharacterized protein FOMMEDRAFT_168607 [Fomitiporia mediterranea MF3/22]|uniref:uncharacterized protein n=1 Tax=Fomitiporia mediterranea (strain MF3/22) TaxID=694068 RepID=UPI00044075D9|nr:uncharacterized protein FOMMEDRAFT_168607 [Fomitiporia mediterranea MF3/22]EJD02052.1 hypothetical protein FOMMEDRAFT_168607 [Fomitiporia mediterranea MF3/22]